jgi:hypothetical protein
MAFTGKVGPKVTILSVLDYQSQKDKFIELADLIKKAQLL